MTKMQNVYVMYKAFNDKGKVVSSVVESSYGLASFANCAYPCFLNHKEFSMYSGNIDIDIAAWKKRVSYPVSGHGYGAVRFQRCIVKGN